MVVHQIFQFVLRQVAVWPFYPCLGFATDYENIVPVEQGKLQEIQKIFKKKTEKKKQSSRQINCDSINIGI